MEQTAELRGYLFKTKRKGRLASWKKRFFSRTGDRLFYFKTAGDPPEANLGYIDLNDMLSAHPTMDSDRPHAFQINTEARVWFLAASSELELSRWILGLVKTIKATGSDLSLAQDPPGTPEPRTGTRDDSAVPSQPLPALGGPRRSTEGRGHFLPTSSKPLPAPPGSGTSAMDDEDTSGSMQEAAVLLRSPRRPLPLPPGKRGPPKPQRAVPQPPKQASSTDQLSRSPSSALTDSIREGSETEKKRRRSVSLNPSFSYLSGAPSAPDVPSEDEDGDGEGTCTLLELPADISGIPVMAGTAEQAAGPPPALPPRSVEAQENVCNISVSDGAVPTHSASLAAAAAEGKEGTEVEGEEKGVLEEGAEEQVEEDIVEQEEDKKQARRSTTGASQPAVAFKAQGPARSARPKRTDWTQSIFVASKSMGSKSFLDRSQHSPTVADDSHRTKLVKEMLATEESYCKSLLMIIQLYINPLKQLDKRTVAVLPVIFSNVELIHQLNSQLLSELQGRVGKWNDDTSLLGDVFIRYAPMLKMYSSYGNNYDIAIKTYQTEKEENLVFKEAVDDCDAASGILLHHLLIQPIQRIPRYNMLLKDILKRTAKIHPDYVNLSRALREIQLVATHINEDVRKTERNRTLVELGGRMDISGLIAPHRQLVREAIVTVQEQRDKKDKSHFQVLLFNDILIHVPKSKVKKPGILARPEYQWPLNLTWVGDVSGSQVEVTGPGPRTFVLLCDSEEEAGQWKRSIEEATVAFLESIGKEGKITAERAGAFTFQDESEYNGNWRLGMMHGTGSFSYLGNIYDGEFRDNRKELQGRLSYALGGVYEGMFVKDNMSGDGKFIYANKDVFVGGFREGRRDGMGLMQYASGDSYTGMWQNNVPHGQGKIVYVTGRRYQGEWVRGVRQGSGCFEDGRGAQYEGQWANDRMHGKGTLVSMDGTFYEGYFAHDLYEGQGVLMYKDGRRYEGAFKGGKRHGKGVYSSAVGQIASYDGEWAGGLPHGKGILLFADNNRFEGSFRDGKMHGGGVLTLLGVAVEGKWSNGLREGKTVIRVGDKVIYSGVATAMGVASPGLPEFPLPEIPPLLMAEL